MSDPTLTFGEFFVAEYRPTITVEDSIRRCCTLAGVSHDFEFKYEIDEDFSTGDLSNFDEAGATGTWSVDGGRLKGIGGGVATTFYPIQHNTEIGPSFVLTFKKWGSPGGITLLDNNYLVAWGTDETAIKTLDTDTMKADEILDTRPIGLHDGVDVKICVKYQGLSQYDVIDYVSISVYQADRCFVAASDFIYDQDTSDTTDFEDYIGFSAWGSDTIYFDDIKVPEIHTIKAWTSVDPGETVGSGLARAMGTDPIFYFMRYDGTLAAWVPGDRDLDWAVPTSRGVRHEEKENYMTPGRVRMVGAYYEAEAWNEDLMTHSGRDLFALPNNPNLMTEDEAYDGAVRAHRIMREEDDIEGIRMPANPLLEPQDRITFDGDDLRVMGIQLTVRGVGRDRPPIAESTIEVQEYIAEGS